MLLIGHPTQVESSAIRIEKIMFVHTNTTKKASFIQFSTHATTNNPTPHSNNPTPHSNDQPQKPNQDEKAPLKEQDDQKQDLDKKSL
jgi:hypothetical protein